MDASGVVNEVCDAGLNELMGILYDGVGGTITNNNVQHIQQAVNSGCQEGHGIAVFNSTSTTKSVTITNNMVTDYQKTGILIDGNVSATIQNNTVSGKGQIDYIAQNGIQISGGASAKISGNSISNNYYGPAKVVACGILLYKAGGVSGASKNGLSYLKSDNTFANNEVDVCNFGKGGGFTPAS